MLNCSVFEPIIEHAFYDGVCDEAVEGLYSIWAVVVAAGVCTYMTLLVLPFATAAFAQDFFPAEKPEKNLYGGTSGIRHERHNEGASPLGRRTRLAKRSGRKVGAAVGRIRRRRPRPPACIGASWRRHNEGRRRAKKRRPLTAGRYCIDRCSANGSAPALEMATALLPSSRAQWRSLRRRSKAGSRAATATSHARGLAADATVYHVPPPPRPRGAWIVDESKAPISRTGRHPIESSSGFKRLRRSHTCPRNGRGKGIQVRVQPISMYSGDPFVPDQ